MLSIVVTSTESKFAFAVVNLIFAEIKSDDAY